MKIVQLSAVDSTQIRMLLPLNKKCKEVGMDVHCICKAGPYLNDINKENFTLHNISIDRHIHPIKNLKSIVNIVKVLKEIKPDIVHVHTPIASVLGRVAAKIAKVPTIIYTAHGFYFHEGMPKKQYNLFFNIEKYIGRFFTDYILTQSKEDFDIAVKNNFLPKSKKNNYLHISNGIDLDYKFNFNRFSDKSTFDEGAFKKKLNITEKDTVVTFIGRLVKEKGIIDLLEGYDLLESKNVKLIIIGELDKSERDQESINEINRFKDNPNIILTGQIANINEYLYISDIFCLPSYREGMPRSIIEAMAMKNAVIATNIRGSREEVIENETGYLIDTNSSKSIAEKIDYLINNPEIIEKFKENGYKRAKQYYDEKHVVNTQIELFNKVVSKNQLHN